MHVDEGVAAGGVLARYQDRVGVSHHRQVAQVLVVGAREQEDATAVVGRDRLRVGSWVVDHFVSPSSI